MVCKKFTEDSSFVAISAGMMQYMLCSTNCFLELHVATAHPVEPCEFKVGSLKPYMFITNIGFGFTCREDPKSFATVFGSIFYCMTRGGNKLENYIDPESAARTKEDDLYEVDKYQKILNEYEEFRLVKIRLEVSEEPETPPEALPFRHVPESPAPPTTSKSRPITPPAIITGSWLGDDGECKSHIVSRRSSDPFQSTAPIAQLNRLREPRPRSQS